MNITPPTPEVTQGPEWAQDINTILTTTIAEHNHQSPNGGVALTQDALNITDELSMNGNQLTNVDAIGLETLNAPASGSNRVYNDSGDLYYKDGNGTSVRITQNGGLAAASFGGISGLSGTDGTATFAGLSTFVWKKDATAYATMENGPVKLYSGNDAAPTSGIILESPDGLASDTTLILPYQLPADINFMLLSGSGEITASIPVTGGIAPFMLQEIPSSKILNVSGTVNFDNIGGTGTAWVDLASQVIEANGKPIAIAIQGTPNAAGSVFPRIAYTGGGGGTNASFLRCTITGSFSGSPITRTGKVYYFVGATADLPADMFAYIYDCPTGSVELTLQGSADSGVTFTYYDSSFTITQL